MANSLGNVGVVNRVSSQRQDQRTAAASQDRNRALDQQNQNSTIRRADERTRIGDNPVEVGKGDRVNIHA